MISKSKAFARSIPALAMAALVVLAVGPSAAQAAPRWKVNGSFMAEGATNGFTGTSGQVRLEMGGSGLTVICKQSGSSGEIEGSASGTAGKSKNVVWTFTGCEVAGIPTSVCSVYTLGQEPGTIRTTALKARLAWQGTSAVISYLPETGSNIANATAIEGVEGEECAARWGPYPITGELVGKVMSPVPPSEATEMAVQFAEVGSSLKWGIAVYFDAFKAKITLGSGQTFGIAEG